MVKNVLFKKDLREIKENIKQYMTVIIIAILAVALFTGIYANWQDFKDKVDTIYQRSNMADGIITSSGNQKDIKTYLDGEDITYEERLYLTAKVDSYNVVVMTFNENSTIDVPAYQSVDDITSNMVLVDENFLIKTELNVGDTFTLTVPSLTNMLDNLELENILKDLDLDSILSRLGLEDIFKNIDIADILDFLGLDLSDVKLTFRVAGTMTHPEALDNGEYQANTIYLGEDALVEAVVNLVNNLINEHQILLPSNLVSNVLIKFLPDLLPSFYNQILLKGDNTSQIISYVADNYDVLYALNRADLPTNMNIESDILQAKQLIYIFPVLFYLVAVLIILTSIQELINKEKKNIGLLKALGYSNVEILLHYTNSFVILCIIGGIIGMIIGPLIIPPVMNQKYQILYQLPDIKVPFFRPFYLLSVLLLIVIVYLTAIMALASILREVPASSIRGDNSYQMKATLFDKLPIKKDKFLTLKMALRNMKRKVSRTLMVILGVTGCSALLLCGFGIEDTLDYSVNQEITLIPFDLNLSYDDEGSRAKELEKIEDITYIDEYTKVSINIKKDKMISSYLFILPEVSHIFVPKYDEGSCLISSKVASEINAKVGDFITFIYNGTSYRIRITDIIDISFSQGIFISCANNLISISPTNCWLKTIDSSLNDDILAKCLEIEGISYGTTLSSLKAEAESRLASINIMTNTIKIFAILLAIVVLYNLALLNFKDRIKDIATLKVLGFNLREIAASFLLEIIILTVFSSLIGLVLGYPLMYGVLVINENPLLSYIYHINVSSYLYTLLLTAGFGIVINLLMSAFVNKVKMVESLKAVD